MDDVFRHNYFYYKDHADSSSSYGQYHGPRDIVVHYPHAEPEAEAAVELLRT
jgi:hypothetical protein